MKQILIGIALVSFCCGVVPHSPAYAATEVDASASTEESREVIAEGRAAIGSAESGGALAARQAAIALALRNALEKTVGVYVSAQSLTQNYQLVHDEVLTHTDGFVTLKEVIRTERGTDTVRVVIRAVVSIRPLAERLKALRVTRGFRLFVDAKSEDIPTDAVTNALTDAGFYVTEKREGADLIVRVVPRFTVTARTPLDTAAGPMTMQSIRADVTLKAIRAETGEVVATLTGADTEANISAGAARTEATTDALQSIAPRLADALITIPAAATQPVGIVVTGLSSVTQAAALEESLNIGVPGVQKVTRRGYDNGRTEYELDILTDALPLLARSLETQTALKRFHLVVSKESRSRVVASVASGSR